MAESNDSPTSPDAAVPPADESPAKKPKSAHGLIICPYCGHVQPKSERCGDCGGLFEPLSRKATQIAMGPWYIRDKRMPFRPGCSYDVVVNMAKAGKIKSTTVVRGPSTRQFWTLARNAPGISHHVGYCHKCGEHVSGNELDCPRCSAPFKEVKLRDHLGLMFPSSKDARRAQKELEFERKGMSITEARREMANQSSGGSAAGIDSPGGSGAGTFDLLDQVLDLSELDDLPTSSSGSKPAAAALDFEPDPVGEVELLESSDSQVPPPLPPSSQPSPPPPARARDAESQSRRAFGSKAPAEQPAATSEAQPATDIAPTGEIPRQPISWVVWVLATLLLVAAVITVFWAIEQFG